MWKERVNHNVTPLQDGSARCLVTQIGPNSAPVYIVNAYMPTDGGQTPYPETLDEIYEVMEKYRSRGKVLWLGDLNASFTRKTPSSNDRKFISFCNEMSISSDSTSTQPSYYHFMHNITSRIDHILALPEAKETLSDTWVEERHPLNTSSHDPVMANVKISRASTTNKESSASNQAKSKPNWRKIDIKQYEELTNLRLDALVKHDGMSLPAEVLVERLYDIMLRSAEESGPPPRKSKRRDHKYPWAPHMKPKCQEMKKLYYEWKCTGKNQDHPLKQELVNCKRALRAMQRQLAAEHRRELLQEISQASTDNKQLFYKLVHRQRKGRSETCTNMDFGPECTDQLEGWAQYYEDLASDKPLPHFDQPYLDMMKSKFHLTCLLDEAQCNTPHKQVSEGDIRKHVKTLKCKKAADVYGLTAEHMKYCSPQLIPILTKLTNTVFEDRKLPDKFKVGAIVPTHKKKKPVNNPDSYRRITIASNLGKVVEKEMMARTKPASKSKQDPLQYGFTEEVSPSICALMLTEAVAEAQDQKMPLFLSFMDSSKAFDMVDHTILLNSLHDLDLEPHLWFLYKDMYSKVQSKVKINGRLSRCIQEERGIRQGGETSTEGFKAKENPFLNRIRKHPVSYKIGSVSVGIPTVADDNCMIAQSHTGAQTQLLLAEANAARVRYVFSETKSKVMKVGEQAAMLPLKFNNTNIEYSQKETHLGLIRTPDGKAGQAVAERIQIGRRTANALMGAGLHGINGISPHTSKMLISTYVDPAVLYGLEALCMSETDFTALDKAQRTLLRQMQSLPESTAIPAIYLLPGILPLSAQVHKKILNLYNTIIRRPASAECRILVRQLAMKNTDSNSWTSLLKKVLYQYKLPSPIQLADNPPSKPQWKAKVKAGVHSYWNRKLKEDASNMKSLSFLNTEICAIGFSHPVWVCGNDPLQATMAATKATLLVGRYPLTALKCAGKKQLPLCPLCNTNPETVKHFILQCTALEDQRKSYMAQLTPILQQHNIKTTEDILRCILDPSHASDEEDDILKMEEVTRRMCHSLHNQRSILMGTGSMTSRALKRVMIRVNAKRKKQAIISKTTSKISKFQNSPTTNPEGSHPTGVLLPERRNILHK